MQRKPGFPSANCSIKMPDSASLSESVEDEDPQQRRLQLINFGHAQWGFKNWSWVVTKQELDFVELINGKYSAGVVSFVSVSVKNLDIHRENIGYATSFALSKGAAIHSARKCAVTNALRETLLGFGGNVATGLTELLETNKPQVANVTPFPEPTPPLDTKHSEPKNSPLHIKKDSKESTIPIRPHPVAPIKNAVLNAVAPVAKTQPMPAALPCPANRPPLAANTPRPAPYRPNSNVSYVLQPVMSPMYGPPRLAAPAPLYSNYYEYAATPWHFSYDSFERHHGNVNLNFNIPPKNLVVNSRGGSVECKNTCNIRPPHGPEGEPLQYPPAQNQGCWVKPSMFYDGFWTEQKVKRWVAEQVEKQFPEDPSKKPPTQQGPAPPHNDHPDTSAPKP